MESAGAKAPHPAAPQESPAVAVAPQKAQWYDEAAVVVMNHDTYIDTQYIYIYIYFCIIWEMRYTWDINEMRYFLDEINEKISMNYTYITCIWFRHIQNQSSLNGVLSINHSCWTKTLICNAWRWGSEPADHIDCISHNIFGHIANQSRPKSTIVLDNEIEWGRMR